MIRKVKLTSGAQVLQLGALPDHVTESDAQRIGGELKKLGGGLYTKQCWCFPLSSESQLRALITK